MVYRKPAFTKFAALVLTAATISTLGNGYLTRHSAFAQSFGDSPDGFPIPSSLPEGSSLRVDGSTSMQVTQPGAGVPVLKPNIPMWMWSWMPAAPTKPIQALLNGDIDLVATGRPLTDEEKAEGLIEVPLEREKLAILLGPDNPFEGNLSFEQFARIFRGEITNWSESGRA